MFLGSSLRLYFMCLDYTTYYRDNLTRGMFVVSYGSSEYTHYGTSFTKYSNIYRSTGTPHCCLLLSSCASVLKYPNEKIYKTPTRTVNYKPYPVKQLRLSLCLTN
jgi:hypothetical protein